MEKIYMPSKDVLIEMQDRGANVYKYILTKAIESIMRCGVMYPDAGKLKYAQKYLRENIEISRAICTLYPEEMKYSQIVRGDIELCLRLIRNSTSSDNRLNYLGNFLASVQKDPAIVTNVILLLEAELNRNPRYRFEFNGYSFDYSASDYSLLNDIFEGGITNEKLEGIYGQNRKDVVRALVNIDPAYAITLPINNFNSDHYINNEYVRSEYLDTGIYNYAKRYGISSDIGMEYIGKDIITKPNDDVKKLMRCIQTKNDR